MSKLILFPAFIVLMNACNSQLNKDKNSLAEADSLKKASETQNHLDENVQADKTDYLALFIKMAQKYDYSALPLANWPSEYINSIEVDGNEKSETIITLPPRPQYKALVKSTERGANFESEETVIFYNLTIRTLVMQQVSKSSKPDFKITEFAFTDSSSAAMYQTIFNDIAAYTTSKKGLNSPAKVWQYKNFVYLLRVRNSKFPLDLPYGFYQKAIFEKNSVLLQ